MKSPPINFTDLAELSPRKWSASTQLNVPLKVDIKAGPNWAAAEEVDEWIVVSGQWLVPQRDESRLL